MRQRRLLQDILWTLSLAALLTGCGLSRGQIATRLKALDAEGLHAPDKHVVLLLLDGCQTERFERLLSTGELPAFQEHLVDRGVYVEQAVASLTSSTFPNIAGIVTGLYPGHCNLPANHIFERGDALKRDFANWRTIYRINDELDVPTIFERLESRYTATISSAIAKGSDIWIRNTLTTGAAYLLKDWRGLDRQTLEQVGDLLEVGQEQARIPHFIFAHLIGVDGIGHTLGPESPEYEAHLRFLDHELGKLMARLARAGLYERVAFVLISDHGQASITTPFNIEGHVHRLLAEHPVKEPCTDLCYLPGLHVDGKPVPDTFEAVVTVGGYRDAIIYFHAPDRAQLVEALDDPAQGRVPMRTEELTHYAGQRGTPLNLIRALAQDPAVGHVVLRDQEPEHFLIVNRDGWGRISRRQRNGKKVYRYAVIEGDDPLGYQVDAQVSTLLDGGFYSSREWLHVTIHTAVPDVVPQVPELFDSPKMGDLLVTAAAGYGFRPKPGGHGGFLREEMLVPFIMAGPGIIPHRVAMARNVDITPVLLHYLGFDDERVMAELDGEAFCPIAAVCPYRGPHPSVREAGWSLLNHAHERHVSHLHEE